MPVSFYTVDISVAHLIVCKNSVEYIFLPENWWLISTEMCCCVTFSPFFISSLRCLEKDADFVPFFLRLPSFFLPLFSKPSQSAERRNRRSEQAKPFSAGFSFFFRNNALFWKSMRRILFSFPKNKDFLHLTRNPEQDRLFPLPPTQTFPFSSFQSRSFPPFFCPALFSFPTPIKTPHVNCAKRSTFTNLAKFSRLLSLKKRHEYEFLKMLNWVVVYHICQTPRLRNSGPRTKNERKTFFLAPKAFSSSFLAREEEEGRGKEEKGKPYPISQRKRGGQKGKMGIWGGLRSVARI